MNITPLFPQLIAKTKLNKHQEFKETFAEDLIQRFEQKVNTKFDWAKYCNSWQIDALPEMNILEQELLPHIRDWCEHFNFSPFDFKIGAWWNVHTSDMYQETHDHMFGRGVLCGIYYLQLNKEDSPIVFMPHQDEYQTHLLNLGIKFKHDYLAFESNEVSSLNIEEGDLILFAPDNKHLAPKAKQPHKGHRISLAFNVEKIG